MTQNDDKHYEQLNAIERVKLALAKHTAGEPFAVNPEDVQRLVEAYDRLRT
jgi:hypothetical protein